MGKTGKYILIGAGGLFAWWFIDRNVVSLGFPHFQSASGLSGAGRIIQSGRPAVVLMGIAPMPSSDAGQAMARRRVNFAPPVARLLFGAHGAGQLAQAATQLSTAYNPPAQPPPIGAATYARPDVPPPPPPAVTSPQPAPTAQETAGDRGKLTAPVVVGGLLILLVVLYFIAK